MNGWEKMFDGWHERYYDDLFMFVCELTAIILGLIYHRKNRVGQFFIFYVVIDISLLVYNNYYQYFSGRTSKEFSNSLLITNSFSFLGEILAYLFFFQHSLENIVIKRLIPIFRVSFIILVFFHLLNVLLLHIPISGVRDMYYLGAIEFFFLIIPCLFYFAELFSRPSAKNLFQRPSFWITTGIVFYTFISIPYYFITDYLLKSNYKYEIEFAVLFFSLPYGITFLFLSKAFLCKTELTT
jgi:hypothetical protein